MLSIKSCKWLVIHKNEWSFQEKWFSIRNYQLTQIFAYILYFLWRYFYDVCIVDVRDIMTKGSFIDSYDYKENVLAEQRLTAPFLHLAAASRLKLNTTFVMDNRRIWRGYYTLSGKAVLLYLIWWCGGHNSREQKGDSNLWKLGRWNGRPLFFV